jgi:hypothetical protein
MGDVRTTTSAKDQGDLIRQVTGIQNTYRDRAWSPMTSVEPLTE